jgi:hypothetical protein
MMNFKAVNPNHDKFDLTDMLGNPIRLGSVVAFGYGKVLPIQIGVVININFGGFLAKYDRANLDIAVPQLNDGCGAAYHWEGTLIHKEYFSRVIVIAQKLDPTNDRHRRLLDIQHYYRELHSR